MDFGSLGIWDKGPREGKVVFIFIEEDKGGT